MAKAGVFMGIILFGAVGWTGVYSSGVVGRFMSPSQGGVRLEILKQVQDRLFAQVQPRNDNGGREKVLRITRAEVGVKEVGSNDGKRVREYLAYTGIKVPAPYCASYISWCFGKAGYAQPRTAWSPAMFPASRIVKEPKPADVFGIWFRELKRVAHVGLVAEVKGEWLLTCEGNSNNNGSRNGDGVYQRLRHKRTIYKYANWVD